MRRDEIEVNYAANPYGLPPEQRRRRGLPTSLLLTVAGVTVFAGAVMVAISMSGTGIGAGDGPPPVIEADTAPMKSRPADAGADDAPPPDRLVYERLSGATRPSVERLLPPPEQPMPRPIVVPDLPPPPEPVRPVLLPPPANMLATPTPAPTVAPPPPVAPPPVASTPVAATKPPPAPPVVATTGGAWRIQLASVRSEAEAAAEWKRLSSRFPAALSGLNLQVSKADLGEKGVYYRVQGGGVDEAGARAVCDQLKSQNVGCVVVRP